MSLCRSGLALGHLLLGCLRLAEPFRAGSDDCGSSEAVTAGECDGMRNCQNLSVDASSSVSGTGVREPWKVRR